LAILRPSVFFSAGFEKKQRVVTQKVVPLKNFFFKCHKKCFIIDSFIQGGSIANFMRKGPIFLVQLGSAGACWDAEIQTSEKLKNLIFGVLQVKLTWP
jgi:hypothetical protein